jgi:hypothetical protein
MSPVTVSLTYRVDDVLLLILIHLGLVRVSRDEDVDVELSLQRGQRLRIAPRHAQVAVRQTESELADLKNLLLGEIRKTCTQR